MLNIFKVSGLIVIIAASTLAGNYFSCMLKCRLSSLKKMNYMIDEIIMMIRFRSPTVYEISEALAKSERFVWFDFLDKISSTEGVPFQMSWCKAVLADPPKGMKASDIELLSDVGRKLGTSDAESQINTLKLQQAELVSAIAAAESDFTKKGNLYRSMGALTGAFISIMLI
ncbi:MAG: stage III sporulation protein AB [Oscillospiraceae bacterium]|nr:stage III sporulation protein AB [Oscillospiraceae bacterium]